MDTGDYPGFVAAMEARRRHFIAHGATSADHSHEDVRTDALEPAEADRIYRAALAGTATRAEAVALRRHMLLEMARMSCEDGLVMTLHPGVRRGHHGPTADALRARRRRGHPDPGRVHRRAAPAARALRHPSRVPPRGLHARRDGVVARARAAGRLLPGALRGRAVVVPRRARGDPPLPPRDHRDRRLLAHLGLHRRHPRVLLDPRPPRHVAPPRRGLGRRARRRAPARRRTRRPR